MMTGLASSGMHGSGSGAANPLVRQFLDMGFGIETRAARVGPYWAHHQQLSRETQLEWLAGGHGDSITILGAGRLLDVAAEEFERRFAAVTLVDADPACVPVWRSQLGRAAFVTAEVSGALEAWTAWIGRGVQERPWRDALELLAGGGPEDGVMPYRPESSSVLSVSLLSQIPIAWQDAVEEILFQRYGRSFVGKHDQEWIDALEVSARRLVDGHIGSLGGPAVRDILVITDVEYAYYRGRGDREPPVRWEAGEWRADPGTTCEVEPALYGADPDSEAAWRSLLPDFSLAWRRHWLWHISPQGVECPDQGTVHRVGAYCLVRRHDAGL